VGSDDTGAQLDVIGGQRATGVHGRTDDVVLALGDRLEERGEEPRLPASGALGEELEDYVVVTECSGCENPEEVVCRVELGMDHDGKVVVFERGDGSRVEAVRNECLSEAVDMAASSEAWTSALEIREHRVELERADGAERVTNSPCLLSVDFEPERVGCAPDERCDLRWVLGRRRQQQLAMDRPDVHADASAASG
jgi:hypothetical protein